MRWTLLLFLVPVAWGMILRRMRRTETRREINRLADHDRRKQIRTRRNLGLY